MSFNKSSKRPFCKICCDAGKPEAVYTGHWVKDLSGSVTCPTLLATECPKCFQTGHTARYCQEKPKPKPATTAVITVTKHSVVVEPKKEVSFQTADFPSLAPSKTQAVKTGWAAAIAKPKATQQKKEDEFIAQLEERSLRKQLPQSAFRVEYPKRRRLTDSVTGDRSATRGIYAYQEMDLADYDYCYDSE